MRLLPLILLAVACAPAPPPTGPAEDADGWSKPVDGLQGRLGVERKEPFNGTPVLIAYLELRNVSDRGNVMEVPIDLDKVEYTVTTVAGKPVAATGLPWDGITVELGTLRLPHDSRLRFRVSQSGAGVPKDQAGLLDLGPSYAWVFKAGDEQTYRLHAKVTVKEGNAKHWSGTLELPGVKLPALKQDR